MVKERELRIEFRLESPGVFSVDANSERGVSRSTFSLPFEPEEAGKLLRRTKSLLSDDSSLRSEEHIGEILFDALVRDDLVSLFDRTLDIDDQPDVDGVRIRLVMNLDDENTARLSAIPWELLAKHKNRPLSTQARCWIVRHVDVDAPTVVNQIHSPLRILVAVANPTGTFDIDHSLVEKELGQFHSLFAERKDIEVTFVSNASVSSIREVLSQKDYHSFHYLGHGSFMRGSGKGFLYLEGDDGSHAVRKIDGLELGTLLRNHATMRMVVLNACKTAETTFNTDYDPFQGVATALVKSGLPAVIAMQYVISVDAAVQFSKGFYSELFRSGKVDKAASAGRIEIFHGNSRDVEWATPVLFMRTPNGRLFGIERLPVTEANSNLEEPKNPPSSGSSNTVSDQVWAPGKEEDLGMLMALALSGDKKPDITDAFEKLKDSIKGLEGATSVMYSLEDLEEKPNSEAYLKLFMGDLKKLQPLSSAAVQQAAEALSEAVTGFEPGTSSIELNVTGTGHTFTATGNINVGGDFFAGGGRKKGS
ncbi:CHAT domain-containing protein [bacterium]|nr:CHAT domain-containing protein [bacterium]